MDKPKGKRPAGDGHGGNKQKRQRGDKNSIRAQIDACAQRNDLVGALKLFRQAKANGPALQPHTCNVLLHLCSQRSADAPDAETAEVGDDPSQEVYDYMIAEKVEPTEMTFTALGRCAALRKDPAAAFKWVKEMRAKGIEPKLRSFTPSLQSYCEALQVEGAKEVLAEIKTAKLALTEVEYGLLLNLYSATDSLDDAWALLNALRTDLRVIGDAFSDSVIDFFEKQGWSTETGCTVSEEGVCSAASEVQLQPADLTDEEREELASGIAELAKQRERAEDFDKFEAWLSETGPYDVVIDGANVGMHNQSYDGAQFNFSQVRRLVEDLRLSRPDDAKPVMLVLHERRINYGPAKSAVNKAIIADWRSRGELHVTPDGSNDDWYWLYAAVKERTSILITNDELRDHIFQMLPAPRLFYKWQARHQVRFKITPTTVALEFPPSYTTCIQEGKTWWMFPTGDGAQYLLARKK